MRRHEQLIIFDLDDTLVDTSDVYWRARSRFVDILAEQGCNPEEATELFEAVDSDHMPQFGFAPERYGRSMMVTYERLLATLRRGRCDETLERIRSAGNMILELRPRLIEGAKELLEWSFNRFTLALISRGDEQLQAAKLAHLQLAGFFAAIAIVRDKVADTFRRCMNDMAYAPGDTWVIGDSIRTDMNPGLEAGARCIHYRYSHHAYHWRQEHGHLPRGEFHSIGRLTDAVPILSNALRDDRTASESRS